MAIKTLQTLVEAHHSIGLVERYHASPRRAFEIISQELKGMNISKDMILQMSVKALHDTAGPDGIVPTLLVFGSYPRMSELDPQAPSISQRSLAISKAMKEVRKLRALRQVTEALRQRNGPSNVELHKLPLHSDVLVWRENLKWTGPFKLLLVEGETCKVELPSGPTSFRSSVKPYFHDVISEYNKSNDKNINDSNSDNNDNSNNDLTNYDNDEFKNNNDNINKSLPQSSTRRNPVRSHRLPSRYQNEAPNLSIFFNSLHNPINPNFTSSRQKELDRLIEKGVFEILSINGLPKGSRIFNSRFVDSIKHAGTTKAFENSRLVVQAYNDAGKYTVLTQSPTLQRLSQRIILSIAASLRKNTNLYLRDISQAYVQSSTVLNRNIFVQPPKELGLSNGLVLQVVKPLYGIPEAGNHWYNTYHKHHINRLKMTTSSYDSCLLFNNNNDTFGIVGLQTDDTLFVANKRFVELEKQNLLHAGFEAKPCEILTNQNPLTFNGSNITIDANSINISQTTQCEKLEEVSLENMSKDNYIAQ